MSFDCCGNYYETSFRCNTIYCGHYHYQVVSELGQNLELLVEHTCNAIFSFVGRITIWIMSALKKSRARDKG
jgi:hypothetical protein